MQNVKFIKGVCIGSSILEVGKGAATLVGNGSSDAARIARIYRESDCGAVLAVDYDVGERRDASDFDSNRRQKPSRNSDGFDRLIDGSRSHSLNLDGNAVLHHAAMAPATEAGDDFDDTFRQPTSGLCSVVDMHILFRLVRYACV